ncbi:hypothetical protein PGT21_004629 [Puccinia graminis f. sp. tritici]|uniref:Uncharacterized protein n=1 Tax=Puccinia graminis f. sp. tritici TaxID=56615 RepID=A0A5B0PRN3_PUCGR|nr:hypothetical protein PGTUg99_021594 [Puccinia graminis f. sp. tritici]KAA1103921.1 hypothetical protein PGT21_004629 [Puccinia graminis f. sp. tritici]
MISNKSAKQDKLARKLLPNQSIRSDQKKLSSQQCRPPAVCSLPGPVQTEIDWFDCSQNAEKKNEDCLNTLFEIIDSPPSPVTKSRNRGIKTTKGEGNVRQDPCSSNARIPTDNATSSTTGPSNKVLKFIEKNNSDYLKYKANPDFILGLNSTLRYLENLRLILVQLGELSSRSNRREDEEEELERGDAKLKNDKTIEMTRIENEEITGILRDLQTIKFIVVFKHHQHLPIINLLSTFVHEINQALHDLDGQQQSMNSPKSIRLVGFPVGLNPPLISKFNVRRLSCFAILDSATGIERLNDFFSA